MANVLGELFQNIADAIRSKTGTTDTLKPNEFPAAIEGITTGGGGSSADERVKYVTFVYEENGETREYSYPVIEGDTCHDPAALGLINPTKASTAQYNYTFYGWGASDGGAADANILKNITADKTVYAIFSATARLYTITWLDENGTELPGQKQWAYGTVPSYTPTKEGYDFIGWIPAVTSVTGNATYTAQWEERSVVFEEIMDDWDEIIAACADGSYTTKYKVGNYKALTINGTVWHMQIAAKNTDILADGSGVAPLTFISFDVCQRLTAGKETTWDESLLRTSSIPTKITAYIPENILTAIKEVKKYTSACDSSKNVYETQTVDKIWVPSVYELFGKSSITYATDETLISGETQGAIYSAYVSGALPRAKGRHFNYPSDTEQYLLRSICKYEDKNINVTLAGHALIGDQGDPNGTTRDGNFSPICFCL